MEKIDVMNELKQACERNGIYFITEALPFGKGASFFNCHLFVVSPNAKEAELEKAVSYINERKWALQALA